MAQKKYDAEFKRELYRLREEEGLSIEEALEAVFDANATFKRKYRKRLSGKTGHQRVSAMVNSMRRAEERKENGKVVWCFHMTNTAGTVISNERLSDEVARRIVAALDVPPEVV